MKIEIFVFTVNIFQCFEFYEKEASRDKRKFARGLKVMIKVRSI